ncbi:hypothetical protein PanWU01x14_304930 [Parasponia andersonii]|uniref:Uncharacterized protein n=1 Tax=Parasponia andersonii TaxID=3476 RepID=A0A2P5ASD7_PARAD|nr:hypothetical protein PanWU01x14_304930 [Parasponia andersonii]
MDPNTRKFPCPPNSAVYHWDEFWTTRNPNPWRPISRPAECSCLDITMDDCIFHTRVKVVQPTRRSYTYLQPLFPRKRDVIRPVEVVPEGPIGQVFIYMIVSVVGTVTDERDQMNIAKLGELAQSR